jgi:2-isopropylmalate synthase
VELGVDIMEAGFPIASDGDFEAVRAIAREFSWVQVAALARTTPLDIERAAAALAPARRPRIHTFIATSDLHMAVKLRKTRQQVLDETARAVEQARRYVDDVEFSAEDSTRSDFDFLCQVIDAAVAAGATTINVPDTVGFTVPAEYGHFVRRIVERLRGRAVTSVHCHNDLGLAVANTMASLEAGARQIECTVNGIGERAGNAALEELVAIMNVRKDVVPYTHGIRAELLYPASQLLSQCIGFPVQPNKAIVGRNAFAHEAGIHQDGVIKDRTTYEIMTPQSVGFPETLLVLGKHSGRAALKQRYEHLGAHLTREELNTIYAAFTALADRKKNITDDDLLDLLHTSSSVATGFQLESVEVKVGQGMAHSTVTLARNDDTLIGAATAPDPVTAICAAIDAAASTSGRLESYGVKAKHGSGRVTVELSVKFTDSNEKARTGSGRAEETDLVNAAAAAYLKAVNHLLRHRYQSERSETPVETLGE